MVLFTDDETHPLDGVLCLYAHCWTCCLAGWGGSWDMSPPYRQVYMEEITDEQVQSTDFYRSVL